MIDLYYWPTPNGDKITVMLEETGLDYRIKPVNIGSGDQFQPEFLAIAPNNKMPAIVDHAPADGGPPLSVFESGAILQYLAEKTGRFGGHDLRSRTEVSQWLMWQMAGLGPMSGQMGHFAVYAPQIVPYAIERYDSEVRRLHRVLDKRLSQVSYLAGEEYSIADMAAWPWIDVYAKRPPDFAAFPHMARWHAAIAERPAVKRACALRPTVNPQLGQPLGEEEKRHLFGQR